MGKKLTTEEYNKQIKSIGWEAIEEYQGATTKIKHKCLKCHNERLYDPHTLKGNKSKCYCCGGKMTVQENVDYARKWCKDNNYILIDIFYKDSGKGKKKKRNIAIRYLCKKHPEEIQEITIYNTKVGKKCGKCRYDISSQKNRKSKEEMTNLFKENNHTGHKIIDITNRKQIIYSKYKWNEWIAILECPVHGEYTKTLYQLKHCTGCPKCAKHSLGEEKIFNWLTKYNINFVEQYKFNNCRGIKKPLPFDFYIPSLKVAIEYDGIQHFKMIPFSKNQEQNIKNFKRCQQNDKIKTQYCNDNNIKLIRIPYTEFDNIEEILKKELSV